MKRQNLDKTRVALELDLEKIFGGPIVDEDLRDLIAESVITTIVSRTLRGYGVSQGKLTRFVGYSPAYAKFKGQKNVDLELAGNMLNAIKTLRSKKDVIEIGIDDENAPKAHGHLTGQEGIGPLPRRNFLDLSESEITGIRRSFKKEAEESRTTTFGDVMGRPSQMKSDLKELGITVDDIKDVLRRLKG